MNRAPALAPVPTLVLARLLVAAGGETEPKVRKDLAPLVKHFWEGRDWADRLGKALDELEAAGAVARTTSKKKTLFTLTPEGARLASEALGVDTLPAKTTWAKLKTAHLPALALGRPGAAVGNLKVEVLRAVYGLDLGDRPKIKEATDATAAKLLGLGPGQKFTAENILRKLLHDAGVVIPAGQKPNPTNIGDALFRRALGDPSAKKPADLLVTRSVRAQNNKPGELVDAVLRAWVGRSEAADGPREADPPAEADGRPSMPDLDEFARLVAGAARESPGGWFGDAKVFISHVWRSLRDDPAFRGVDAEAFKGRLVEAHCRRLIELGRADLVDAMDPADVRESATPYLNAVYHFVRTEEPDR